MQRRLVLASVVMLLAASFVASALPAQASNVHARSRPVCSSTFGVAHCKARVVTDSRGTPLATTSPTGYGPAEFHTAYSLTPSTTPVPQTIAIVDAFDDPTAKADLDAYDSAYGLPPFPNCDSTHRTACFET